MVYYCTQWWCEDDGACGGVLGGHSKGIIEQEANADLLKCPPQPQPPHHALSHRPLLPGHQSCHCRLASLVPTHTRYLLLAYQNTIRHHLNDDDSADEAVVMFNENPR